ncbi:hypothetical protein [uncultured Meiothermus sp.]|jgi:hypothetical protein|nr:hypothetical protein [uncultured Meiothermus sp.]
MTGRAQKTLKNLLNHSEIKGKASVRHTISIFSAVIFLGWLILELTLGL